MATISNADIPVIIQLYTHKHLSARQIADRMEVSLGAVYYVLRKQKIARRNGRENNAARFAGKPLSFNPASCTTVELQQLRTAGTMLYWCEGYKQPSSQGVDFANSDPAMIELFMLFLRKVCVVDEERLRAYVYCYGNQNVGELEEFWSGLTGIGRGQFTKAYVRSDFLESKNGRMPYGLLHIRYSDKKLLHYLLSLIEECKVRFCVGTQVVNEGTL